jgi:acyl-CoA thioesterase FadM
MNMTHYFHLNLLEKTKMLFGENEVPGFKEANLLGVFVEPEKTVINYRKDCSLGDKISVKIYPDCKEFCLKFEFIDVSSGEVRAFGEQHIKTFSDEIFNKKPTKPKRSVFVRYFRAVKEILSYLKTMDGNYSQKLSALFFLIKASRKIKKGRYIDFSKIYFSHTNIKNQVRVSQYPEMFGNIRESFAQDTLFRFKEDVGKKYLLKTIDAEYNYFKPLCFGDKVEFRLRVDSIVKRRFFKIVLEYISNGEVVAEATQTIGYTDSTNRLKTLPVYLQLLLKAFLFLGE